MISQTNPVDNTPLIDINVDDPTLNMSPGHHRRIRIRQERAAANKEKIRLYWENKAHENNYSMTLDRVAKTSVGSHKKRNFNDEINEEYSRLDKLEVTLEASMLYYEEVASITTYLQDEFHVCMTDTPVNSIAPLTPKNCRKWLSKNKFSLTTFEAMNDRYKSKMVYQTKHQRPRVLPLFPSPSLKHSRLKTDDSLENKRVKFQL
ncbi:hypothetical protein C1645_736962 [Glomus cerebriforme]|uniref:Uncharacterized protein n=1 Tax=Glomus cerebriforme TaxID=658196 RepID=A0A397T3Z6_9GLOM|nr:hypothetical protein C1645_736962 [Glomus cerebriforme]